jgi:hypothetical protein
VCGIGDAWENRTRTSYLRLGSDGKGSGFSFEEHYVSKGISKESLDKVKKAVRAKTDADVFHLLSVPERFSVLMQSCLGDYMHESLGCELREAMPAGVLLAMANYIVRTLALREAQKMQFGAVPDRILPGKDVYCSAGSGTSAAWEFVGDMSEDERRILQEEEEKADQALRPCGGMGTYNNLRGKARGGCLCVWPG